MGKVKVKMKEAITIADLQNYEKHRLFYKNELDNGKNEDETMKLINDYHNAVISTVDERIVTPYLKSSIERENQHRLKSVNGAMFSGAFTLGTVLSTAGFFATNGNGFLVAGIGCFALATAKVISGIYHLVQSVKEKRKRLDIVSTWEFDKNESPIDVLDFCEENNIELLTNPFNFELTRIRDNREDKTDLKDPFRKNRFKDKARKLVKEGIEEKDYQYYKFMSELALQSDDEEKGFLNDKEEFLNNKGENDQ